MLDDMSIYFRGFDAAVAQQVLNNANIGTRFQKMGSIGVAQHVQGDGPTDSGSLGGLLHHQLQAALAVGLAGPLAFKKKAHGPKLLELLPQQLQQAFGRGQVAVLFALAGAYVQGHTLRVNVGRGQGQHFAQAQAQPVGQHQHGAVLRVVGTQEQVAHFGLGQYLGVSLRAFEAGHLVVLPGLPLPPAHNRI